MDLTTPGAERQSFLPFASRAKHRTADTSHRAFAKSQKKAPKLIEAVLDAVHDAGERGVTRYELVELVGKPVQSICRPVRDLLDAGKIVERGDCRPSPYGHASRVLRAIGGRHHG